VLLHYICYPFGMLIPWTNADFGPVQPLVECNQEIRARSQYLVFVWATLDMCEILGCIYEITIFFFCLYCRSEFPSKRFFVISAVCRDIQRKFVRIQDLFSNRLFKRIPGDYINYKPIYRTFNMFIYPIN